MHWVWRPLRLAFANAGRIIAAKIAMIAMTTSNSINVNALLSDFLIINGYWYKFFTNEAHSPSPVLSMCGRPHRRIFGRFTSICSYLSTLQLNAGCNLRNVQLCFAPPIRALAGGSGDVLRANFEPQVLEIDESDFRRAGSQPGDQSGNDVAKTGLTIFQKAVAGQKFDKRGFDLFAIFSGSFELAPRHQSETNTFE